MLNRVIRYFELARPVLGPGGVKRELILYSGVAAGSVAQSLFSMLKTGRFDWAGLGLGLIASLVTFPTIYNQAGLKSSEVTFVKWCVAFQNGFFWPSLLQQVGSGFPATPATPTTGS